MTPTCGEILIMDQHLFLCELPKDHDGENHQALLIWRTHPCAMAEELNA